MCKMGRVFTASQKKRTKVRLLQKCLLQKKINVLTGFLHISISKLIDTMFVNTEDVAGSIVDIVKRILI
jgi:hypothetical protein